jgi:hypothetical protein
MTDESNEELRRINEEIPEKENLGDRMFFEDRLAPVFVMRRANGALDDRAMFLLSLKPEGKRTCDPKSIDIQPMGNFRALVTSMVKVGPAEYHNLRLFGKDGFGRWKLLAWANEPSSSP